MSSILLTLDSSKTTQPGGDFEITYPQGIKLRGKEYEISLVRTDCWYSWPNLSAAYGNNTVDYSPDGINFFTVTFDDGAYSIDQINDELHRQMKANGHYTVVSGVDTFSINLVPNYSTLKLTIQITAPYEVDLTVSDISTIFGFTPAVLNVTTTGTSNVNITNNINTLTVQCSIVSGSYSNSIASNILFTFLNEVPPGANVVVQPLSRIFLGVNTDHITSIRMRITDQLNRTINFRGEHVTHVLQLRPVKNGGD